MGTPVTTIAGAPQAHRHREVGRPECLEPTRIGHFDFAIEFDLPAINLDPVPSLPVAMKYNSEGILELAGSAWLPPK